MDYFGRGAIYSFNVSNNSWLEHSLPLSECKIRGGLLVHKKFQSILHTLPLPFFELKGIPSLSS